MACSLSELRHVASVRSVAILLIAPCAACLAQNAIQNVVVTSGASFQVGLPAKGSIGTIFCTGLSVQGIVTAPAVPLPFTLAGVTVTVGGAPAPLFAVAALTGYQQINFEVPQEAQISSNGTWQVVVQQNGGQSPSITEMSSTPGDFFLIPGTRYGIFQHGADFSLVTKTHPARPGEILVGYLTGLPEAVPTPATGQAAPLNPPAIVPQEDNGGGTIIFYLVLNGTTQISNQASPGSIPFLGMSPGSVGLYQINFVLPMNPGPGDAQIKLERFACSHIFASCTPAAGQTTDGATVLLPIG